MPPYRPLRLEEIPERARTAFDLSCLGRDLHGRPAVLRTCPDCGAQKWVATAEIRANARYSKVGGRCFRCAQKVRARTQCRKERAARWQGGRVIDGAGYVRVYTDRPISENHTRYVLEHRLVMAGVLGRPLLSHERVHHKNGERQDNRPENLELWHLRSPGQPPGIRIGDYHCPGCRCFGGE